MENDLNNLPMGFGMALAQNKKALMRFAELDESQRQAIIDKTHSVNSKEEMQSLVNTIIGIN